MANPWDTNEREPNAADVKAAVTIEPMALQEEFVRLPADLSYWHQQYARWSHKAMTSYHDRKRVESEVRIDVKRSGEKMNESILDAMVETHPRVVEARKLEADMEARKTFAYGLVDSLRAKKDMLQSLGAHLRAEQDPTIREPKR